jgi:hypothetical protein
MAYHEEDRVARLIMNYVMWAGDNPVRSCAHFFDEEVINMREFKQEWRSSCRMEVLGVEAQLTKGTLEAMVPAHRFALWTFHLSSLTFDMQARTIVKVAKSTYHQRLMMAHQEFIDEYQRQEKLSRERTAAYLQHVR